MAVDISMVDIKGLSSRLLSVDILSPFLFTGEKSNRKLPSSTT